nr:proteasome assembly chaperone 2 [Leptinotarsa decemlineata]
MPAFLRFCTKSDLSGYTLIIPSVSVGNVPQLTVDLLITTYNFKKCATIWHSAIVPSVGSNPYDSKCSDLCTACEIYSNEDLKLAALQIRSTIDYRIASRFFLDLKEKLQTLFIKNVTILSGMFDYEQHIVTKNKFYYISAGEDERLVQCNNITLLERVINGKYNSNGSGFAFKLYETLSTDFRCTVLGKYISEGDNRPDACMFLEKLVYILDLNSAMDLIIPSSWNFVFGAPPPIEIY